MKTSYINPTVFDLAVNRIVPIPKQVVPVQGGELRLGQTSKFNISAEYRSVRAARERA